VDGLHVQLDQKSSARITDDGATYLISDVEWFWTREDVDERFANKERIRSGAG